MLQVERPTKFGASFNWIIKNPSIADVLRSFRNDRKTFTIETIERMVREIGDVDWESIAKEWNGEYSYGIYGDGASVRWGYETTSEQGSRDNEIFGKTQYGHDSDRVSRNLQDASKEISQLKKQTWEQSTLKDYASEAKSL